MMDDENFRGGCPECGMFIMADGTGHNSDCPSLRRKYIEGTVRVEIGSIRSRAMLVSLDDERDILPHNLFPFNGKRVRIRIEEVEDDDAKRD